MITCVVIHWERQIFRQLVNAVSSWHAKEPLIKSRVAATAAFRDGMREARCSQWPLPLASRATKQTARKGAPDSDSRERGAGRGASWRKKHCKMGRSCCRSRTPSFADRVAAAVPSGCGKMRHLHCCAPRIRSPRYDLRRAPRNHPHFACNAVHEGLNQRFPKCFSSRAQRRP
jgi:hypothetical protein